DGDSDCGSRGTRVPTDFSGGIRILRLNLGCGRVPIPGYVNVDLHGGQIRAAAEHLPFRDAVFDQVFALHVLEHVRNLRESMREIRRVLKPWGNLVIRVPFGLKGLYDADHLRAFDEHTFDSFSDKRIDDPCCQEDVRGWFHIDYRHVTRGLPYGFYLPTKYHMWPVKRHAPNLSRHVAWLDSDNRLMDWHFGFRRCS